MHPYVGVYTEDMRKNEILSLAREIVRGSRATGYEAIRDAKDARETLEEAGLTEAEIDDACAEYVRQYE